MSNLRSSAAYSITLFYAVVLAWTTILAGVLVYLGADADLRRTRDAHLAQETQTLSREPTRAELLREIAWRTEDFAERRMGYALFDRLGNRIAGNLDISRPDAGFFDLPDASGGEGSAFRRALATELPSGMALVVATDAAELDRVHAQVIRFFLVTFAAVIGICLASGFLLRWYLRLRLRAISATADAIVTGDIEWRVPISRRGDEFDTAGRAVNLMLDRVAGLMENLRQVSSDIAHDLRKPLLRLIYQTDHLGRVEGAEQRVLDLGDEMLALFTAILRIAEVEGGGIQRGFEPVDLSALMGEVAESFEPALADDGKVLTWQIEPDLVVMGNRELLAQLASNLLDNARIHTAAGTKVRLGLAGDERVRLTIADDGPGVAEADRDKLVQRFFRTEASRTTSGNGLGLSLVAAVAREHGGSVAIEDARPGLRIVVSLPRLSRGQ